MKRGPRLRGTDNTRLVDEDPRVAPRASAHWAELRLGALRSGKHGATRIGLRPQPCNKHAVVCGSGWRVGGRVVGGKGVGADTSNECATCCGLGV